MWGRENGGPASAAAPHFLVAGPLGKRDAPHLAKELLGGTDEGGVSTSPVCSPIHSVANSGPVR
jgi:hypothetical protein